MRDWELFLDKFLRGTELPVLDDAGAGTHDEAACWANEQYDTFAQRRRLEAEAAAGENYAADLRASAQTLEAERKKLSAKKPNKKTAKVCGKGGRMKDEQEDSSLRPSPSSLAGRFARRTFASDSRSLSCGSAGRRSRRFKQVPHPF